jgi:hypothetical protein
MATHSASPASVAERALQRSYPRQEPSALDAHAGICAGGAWQRGSLPRPRSHSAVGRGGTIALGLRGPANATGKAIARRMPPASSCMTTAQPGRTSSPPRPARRLLAWRTSSPTAYKRSSSASNVSLTRLGLRIIRAVQLSAAGGNTGECVAEGSRVEPYLAASPGRNALVRGEPQ